MKCISTIFRVAFFISVATVCCVLPAAVGAVQSDSAIKEATHAIKQGRPRRRPGPARRGGPHQSEAGKTSWFAWAGLGLRKGEYAKGAADVKAAMRLNTADAGIGL